MSGTGEPSAYRSYREFNSRSRPASPAVKTPGELFAQFTPQPKDSIGEDVARQTFALVKAFQDKSTSRKAHLLTVFRFYCVDAFSAAEVSMSVTDTSPKL